MALNKREQILLAATIGIVVVVVTWALFLPLIRTWQRLGADIHQQQRERDGFQAAVARMPQWQADYDQLREQLGQKVEHYEQMSDVLKKIEEVGQAAGVVIQQRRPLAENDRGVYRELPVQCRIEATTDSLVRFLYSLRTGSGFVSVEQLQIVTQGNNSSILRCDILIHALAGKSERRSS
jgi:Tfp pilus assembly protein PilO